MAAEQLYPTYPRDIWDYLDGEKYHEDIIPNMPRREDRDKLFSTNDQRRGHIWDYFFRIKPEDVGKPHRREINELRQKLRKDIADHQKMIRKAEAEIEQVYHKRQKITEAHNQELQRLETRLQNLRGEAGKISAKYDSEIQNCEAKIKQNRLKLKKAPAQKRRNGWISLFLGGGGFIACIALNIYIVSASGVTEPFWTIFRLIFFLIICVGPLVGFGLFAIATEKKAGGKLRFEIQRLTQTIENLKNNREAESKQIKEEIDTMETEWAMAPSNHQAQLAEMDQSITTRKNDMMKLRQELTASEEEINQRIIFLEAEIKHLISQIPAPPSDDIVYGWLKEDLERLEKESIEVTGLQRKGMLPDIGHFEGRDEPIPNPLPIMGPGELQDPKQIPPPFLNIKRYPDRVKHLHAVQAAYILNNVPEVFYGVYKIEHVLVAKDMLTTRGFFFDFITGTTTAEHITEQYYKDIVAIAKINEFRKIELSNGNETSVQIEIEDAPTFTLSLASSEKRTVTFVNSDYFNGIQKRLNLPKDEIQRIKSLSDAKEIAENSIRVLRKYLRMHKGTDNHQ